MNELCDEVSPAGYMPEGWCIREKGHTGEHHFTANAGLRKRGPWYATEGPTARQDSEADSETQTSSTPETKKPKDPPPMTRPLGWHEAVAKQWYSGTSTDSAWRPRLAELIASHDPGPSEIAALRARLEQAVALLRESSIHLQGREWSEWRERADAFLAARTKEGPNG